MDERQRIRVFISSPSDVRPERLLAERVVERLDREFAYHFRVEAVMWEREPLLASHHFQELITPPSETDIAVVVLWSRLGVPLPEQKYRGPVTGQPVTGTEWEFEDALAGYRRRQLPDLLLYRKRAAITVELGDRAAVEERQRQAELVDGFMRHWTQDAAGKSFTAASWEFADATGFEDMLEQHLRALLRRRLGTESQSEQPATVRWHQGSPYRGLESFEPEHQQIFFGRTRARNELRELLARQSRRGTGFVLVMGASGSGKSSLVKAGLLPDLLLPGMVDRVALCRYALTRPSAAPDGDAVAGLAAALFAPAALPELTALRYTPERLVALLHEAPGQAGLPIEQALAAAGQAAGLTAHAQARLVLVVDQLEELFSNEGLRAAQRDAYVAVLEALAQSGSVWVTATMRSDFFDRVETLPRLARLSANEARYLLTPPDAGEIAQVIRQPAREAGLSFEVDAASGKSLDETICAAAQDSSALPLLEYLLDQLWQRRSPQGVLTFEAYAALGGLEGAIGRRAEAVLQAQSAEAQAAFPAVLRALVSVGQGAKALPAARQVPYAQLASDPAARRLVDAMLDPAARLLVADGDGTGARLRIAHEALLSHWERAREQIAEDRRDLQLRGRLEDAAARWREAPPKDRASLLLPPGLPLSEASDLLARRGREIDTTLGDFIRVSARRQSRRQARILAAFATIFLALGIGGVIAYNFGQDYASYRQLREVEARRPDIRGSLVAYGTCPGCEAADGIGSHGLYTEALLPQLARKDQPLSQVFARTHRDVLERQRSMSTPMGFNQIPIIQTSLTGEIFLHDNVAGRHRIALVFGNNDYVATERLKNPVNDAQGVADTLRAAGFDVTMLINQKRDGILAAIDTLEDDLAALAATQPPLPVTPKRVEPTRSLRLLSPEELAEREARDKEAKRNTPLPKPKRDIVMLRNCIVFIYLAGHGAQVGGRALFIPTDVKNPHDTTEEEFIAASVDLGELTRRIEAMASINVLVIDISRNEPYANKLSR